MGKKENIGDLRWGVIGGDLAPYPFDIVWRSPLAVKLPPAMQIIVRVLVVHFVPLNRFPAGAVEIVIVKGVNHSNRLLLLKRVG